MVLDGVRYSAIIQFCRVILSRMVELYCIQSSTDLLWYFTRREPWVVLLSLGVCRRPVFPLEFNAPMLIQYALHHISKILDLLSGEGVSTH